MKHTLVAETAAIPLIPVKKSALAEWLKSQDGRTQAWAKQMDFKAEPGSFLLISSPTGTLEKVIFGYSASPDVWDMAGLPSALPAGTYKLDGVFTQEESSRLALGWGLGCYIFDRYKKSTKIYAQLVWPAQADQKVVERTLNAIALVRDLINAPANDLGPTELAQAAQDVAKKFKASCQIIVGQDLLAQNYPLIYAVGQGALPTRAPRLIDIRWKGGNGPKITLVGKGVCFDTGGLDIKPPAVMQNQKKDMGGAAHALGLAQMIMDAGLSVQLRVLIPAVENAVDGGSFRPWDVFKSRKGLTVEIGDTDAEGRLVLADALTEACTETPDMLIDFATLTGAARVALGVDLPALFCNNDTLANQILEQSKNETDPLWRMPLWAGYRKQLDSKVADLSNISGTPYAGAITAALFLETFVEGKIPWAHIDLMAWNTSSRPGRPEGGEAMTLRTLFKVIEAKARS